MSTPGPEPKSDTAPEAGADVEPAPSGWGDLGGFIRDQRRLTHLSLRKLAELADVSNPYLSQIERGLRKPSADILQQIARALSISAESLYVRAGLLDQPDGAADVVGEIRRDTTLTPDQRRTLVRIYHSFQAENRSPSEGMADPVGGNVMGDEDTPSDEDDESDRDGQESS